VKINEKRAPDKRDEKHDKFSSESLFLLFFHREGAFLRQAFV
jgi:hypothetical protein